MMESTEGSGEGAQSQEGKVFKRQVRRPPTAPRLAARRAFAHPGRRKERAGQQRGSSPPSSAPRSAPPRPRLGPSRLAERPRSARLLSRWLGAARFPAPPPRPPQPALGGGGALRGGGAEVSGRRGGRAGRGGG